MEVCWCLLWFCLVLLFSWLGWVYFMMLVWCVWCGEMWFFNDFVNDLVLNCWYLVWLWLFVLLCFLLMKVGSVMGCWLVWNGKLLVIEIKCWWINGIGGLLCWMKYWIVWILWFLRFCRIMCECCCWKWVGVLGCCSLWCWSVLSGLKNVVLLWVMVYGLIWWCLGWVWWLLFGWRWFMSILNWCCVCLLICCMLLKFIVWLVMIVFCWRCWCWYWVSLKCLLMWLCVLVWLWFCWCCVLNWLRWLVRCCLDDVCVWIVCGEWYCGLVWLWIWMLCECVCGFC